MVSDAWGGRRSLVFLLMWALTLAFALILRGLHQRRTAISAQLLCLGRMLSTHGANHGWLVRILD